MNQELDKVKYFNSLLAYYQINESGSSTIYDVSRYNRRTTFASHNIYWDYTSRLGLSSSLFTSGNA